MASKDDSFETNWNEWKAQHPEGMHVLDSATMRLYFELFWHRGCRFGVKETVAKGVEGGVFSEDFLKQVEVA